MQRTVSTVVTMGAVIAGVGMLGVLALGLREARRDATAQGDAASRASAEAGTAEARLAVAGIRQVFPGQHKVWNEPHGWLYSFEYPAAFTADDGSGCLAQADDCRPELGAVKVFDGTGEVVSFESAGLCGLDDMQGVTSKRLGEVTAYFDGTYNREGSDSRFARICSLDNGVTVEAAYPKARADDAEKIISTLRF